MKKNIILMILIVWAGYSFALQKISSYEYWFDSDYTNKVTNIVTPANTTNVNTMVPTTGLTDGLHTYNIRVKDDAGLWSSTLSQFFYKMPPSSTIDRKIINYECWFDGDYANKVVETVSATDMLNINTMQPTTNLSNGVHTYNVRVKDDSGLWSSTLSQFFYKMPASSTINREIKQYETWFDSDYANKTVSSVALSDNLDINAMQPTTGLSDGVHTYNIRVKDDSGLWSSTLSQFFYKMPASSTINREIKQYETWFDSDYANKTVSSVALSDNLNINTMQSTTGLSNGLHTYNIRVLDDSGLWSSTLSQFFYKMPASSTINRKIKQYETWFDGDYANKTVNAVVATDMLNINTMQPTTGLSNGVHTYNIRVLDDSGLWSSTISQFFYKMPFQIVVENKILTYRYWFDDNFQDTTVHHLAVPVKSMSLIKDIDIKHIPKGNHTINFQFKDSLGLWSLVTSSDIEKLSLPIAKFTSTVVSDCDSSVYTFNDKSIDGDSLRWDFGDGTMDSVAHPNHTYYTPGKYTISLTTTDTITKQDSTKQVQIMVIGKTRSTVNTTACKSYISPSTLYKWTSSGIYQDTIPNFMNCDSIITFDLTINKADISVTQNLNLLTANAVSATYQWLDCNNNYNPILNEINHSFTAVENGSYAVEITQNGCKDTSMCYSVTTAGIGENTFENRITAYPNPTKGQFSINLGSNYQDVVITLNNIIGKQIKQFAYKNKQTFKVELDEPSGVYFMTISSGNKRANIKIIKN